MNGPLLMFLLVIGGGAGPGSTEPVTPLVSMGRFRPEYDAGDPPHRITSGDIYLLDERRAKLSDFQSVEQGPFAFWNARLRSAGPKGTQAPLDQLADYRDNIFLSATNTETCERASATGDSKLDVIVTLPEPFTWKEIAWFGIYCFGYQYVFNFVWINPVTDENGAPSDREFDLPEFVAKPDDVVHCDKKLKACEGTGQTTFDTARFCYRDCDLLKDLSGPETQPGAGDAEEYRCGKNLRNDPAVVHKLYGCSGFVDEQNVRAGEECTDATNGLAA